MIVYIIVLFLLYLRFSKKKQFNKESYSTNSYSNLNNIRDGIFPIRRNKYEKKNKMKCVSNIKPIIYTKGFLLEKSTNLVSFDNLVSSQKYFETGNYKWI